ncbi:hypothetical protein V8C34DRAFT_270095 [Trichoderma compactum]
MRNVGPRKSDKAARLLLHVAARCLVLVHTTNPRKTSRSLFPRTAKRKKAASTLIDKEKEDNERERERRVKMSRRRARMY